MVCMCMGVIFLVFLLGPAFDSLLSAHLYIIGGLHVVIRLSNFADVSILYWIRRGILSLVMDDPTMAWITISVMDTCHLAMGCSRHSILPYHNCSSVA